MSKACVICTAVRDPMSGTAGIARVFVAGERFGALDAEAHPPDPYGDGRHNTGRARKAPTLPLCASHRRAVEGARFEALLEAGQFTRKAGA